MKQRGFLLLLLVLVTGGDLLGNGNVYVTRFWHNHQPIYWPEWNGNGGETERVQLAWDSIVLKSGQTYDSRSAHPENDLPQIFGLDDRKNAYQSGPRNALTALPNTGGFAMSYSGSLMDNVRNLGQNHQLGYSSSWWNGNREASSWTTPSGSRRLDLVGFTYHHSLGPLLPKEVFRKEIRIFKQAWWKNWDKASDLSDHSKGFFPTEMAFSRHLVDVLVDEGYEWSIVASHHLSRTCPTYFDQFDLENNEYGIFSSPPNRADLLGPSPTNGWWYGQPNPGNAAWNVAPFAYQLHRAQYVNPETGAVKTLVMVPSDDVLSYRYGYANEGISKIQAHVSPFATDPARPVLVMPATDGDNAWGGGSSSWFEATPQLFNNSAAQGYNPTTIQDFVTAHNAQAPVAHIEDGAWIFPESDYGSPYFLKWIEPPLRASADSPSYPGTLADLETPGFALKFWSWAPIMSGANWVITAEQIWKDNGGTVEDWKIQAPYENGSSTSPNVVERAWHIYLAGLDSGFNYYGGLGNDDEVKSALATRRAQELLSSYLTANIASDQTEPTVLKPQRFPYNPGGYTFGWFNSIPGGDTRYLKKMGSDFYIWSLVHDVSGLHSVTLFIRVDDDGVNDLSTIVNETYAGGEGVGNWVQLSMTLKDLPNTASALTTAANHGEIEYFSQALPQEIARYAVAKIDDTSLPGFRGKLLDYYIRAEDTRGNVHRSEIQHVFVEDDGGSSLPRDAQVTWTPTAPTDCNGSTLDFTYQPNDGPLKDAAGINLLLKVNGGTATSLSMNPEGSSFSLSLPISPGTTSMEWEFAEAGGSGSDDNHGDGWSVLVSPCPVSPTVTLDPPAPEGCVDVTLRFDPGTGPLSGSPAVVAHVGFNDYATVQSVNMQWVTGAWEAAVQLPPGTNSMETVFRNTDASLWENNNGQDWTWTIQDCPGPYTPDLHLIQHAVTVSHDPAEPADQNNVGDTFDLDTAGGAGQTNTRGGFGRFGAVYVNADASGLILGGTELDVGGDNNAAALFLSIDTLSVDVVNFWTHSGAPQALDQLHNVQFTEGVDLILLLGDEYGDGTFPSFQMAGGAEMGQGVFKPTATGFEVVSSATVSQFDGEGVHPVQSEDDDGNRRTSRWEVRIPWAELGASKLEDLSECSLSGLMLSSATDGPDRYLSGNVLGKEVQSNGELDVYNNFGTAFVTLTPLEVALPHVDGDGDGMPNGFEQEHFGSAGAGDPDEDDDGDRQSNLEEFDLGTDPQDNRSALRLQPLPFAGGGHQIQWQSVGGRTYRVERNDSFTMDPAQWVTLGTYTEQAVAEGVPGTGVLLDPNPGGFRIYRVILVQE